MISEGSNITNHQVTATDFIVRQPLGLIFSLNAPQLYSNYTAKNPNGVTGSVFQDLKLGSLATLRILYFNA